MIGGYVDPAFQGVYDALASNLSSGEELGASIAIDVDGKRVVDIWGGHRDPDRSVAWTEDTIVNVWSTSKLVTNLAALMLFDRGVLDPYAPVSKYWPEFADGGKELVEVRHILSHTSGVSGWDRPCSIEDLYDAPSAAAQLARQEPWWDSRTTSGYHAVSQGALVGELVRRTTRKTLRQFVSEEISTPLGADFQIGAREQDRGRIADIVPPPAPTDVVPDPLKVRRRTFLGPVVQAGAANTAEWRRAEIGAANGHGNARSVSTIMSALSLGGVVNGVRLLGPDAVALAFEEQASGIDLALGVPLRFGMGYALPQQDTVPYISDGCFWGGWGGSLTVMNPNTRTTFSYVMNKMGPGIIGSDRARDYYPSWDA
ncbi:serine hydrolase domain-containing protein [Rhodococcoides kyotonense]|uniref:CubicO group peptidase, beta-lactamase class C family n=1 Tax=Rhodococcoides kyotonense TaxID=398843 RepID=A0A239J4F1_9NOCA|nr:serine hydrolase domain-containing protein [Rhodococcus kyotonensis]SNT00771.1 CubicO group peptidase, beta-lactamase class C family [Rhodococcus kyotonensis]